MKNFIFFLMVIAFIPTVTLAEIDARKSYEAGIDAYNDGDYEKAIHLLENALKAGSSGNNLENTYLKLYYSATLTNYKKRAEIEFKCKEIIPNFKPVNRDALLSYYDGINKFEEDNYLEAYKLFINSIRSGIKGEDFKLVYCWVLASMGFMEKSFKQCGRYKDIFENQESFIKLIMKDKDIFEKRKEKCNNIHKYSEEMSNKDFKLFLKAFQEYKTNKNINKLEKFVKVEEINLNARNFYGYSIINFAITMGKIELVKFLISKNVNVNLGTRVYNNTPLITASGGYNYPGVAEETYVDIIKLLLQNGAKIDAVETTKGMTALGVAIHKGKYKAAKALIENGAKADIKLKNGESLLNIAKKSGNEDIINLILKYSN